MDVLAIFVRRYIRFTLDTDESAMNRLTLIGDHEGEILRPFELDVEGVLFNTLAFRQLHHK